MANSEPSPVGPSLLVSTVFPALERDHARIFRLQRLEEGTVAEWTVRVARGRHFPQRAADAGEIPDLLVHGLDFHRTAALTRDSALVTRSPGRTVPLATVPA